MMLTIDLKDAKVGFSSLVDRATTGEFVTITRNGKPVAALVSVEAGEIARKTMERKRIGFAYLRTFPGGAFERNRHPHGMSIFEDFCSITTLYRCSRPEIRKAL